VVLAVWQPLGLTPWPWLAVTVAAYVFGQMVQYRRGQASRDEFALKSSQTSQSRGLVKVAANASAA
jgi:hypothetical protein